MSVKHQADSPSTHLQAPGLAAPALAVGRRDAAKMLGVSERLLWSWTSMKRIPHVRIGARVLYPVHLLREWLQKNSK